jgi:D-sedoheptulose 7-phosphate isomerase
MMDHGRVARELAGILEGFFETRGTAWTEAAGAVTSALRKGRKVLLFGNGGSAAEAQHFAAELVNRFRRDRRAIPALALTADTSALTAIANDTAFDRVFSRQVEALGGKGDVAIALTTSGVSANVLEGLRAARAKGMITVALTGKGGGRIVDAKAPAGKTRGRRSAPADFLLDVPSASTPRVQEAHLVLLHLLAEEIENRLG